MRGCVRDRINHRSRQDRQAAAKSRGEMGCGCVTDEKKKGLRSFFRLGREEKGLLDYQGQPSFSICKVHNHGWGVYVQVASCVCVCVCDSGVCRRED